MRLKDEYNKNKEVVKPILLSVSEYGQLRRQPTGRKMTRQSIIERITSGKEMPGVISSKKIGAQWVLEVDPDFYEKNKHNLE